MKAKSYIIVLMLCGMAMLSSCNSITAYLTREYLKKDVVENQIKVLESKHKEEVDAKVKDVQAKLEKTITAQDNQLQEGANKLYGANEAFKFYQLPTRLDLIINNRVVEAQAAIGKSPTYEAIKAENQRLKDELDEKKTSLETLRDKHNQVLAENTKLSEAATQAKKEVEAAKAEWLKTEQKYISDATLLDAKLKDANNKIAAGLKEKADNKEAVERMKTKLMVGCGIIAVLAMAAAIYSPVGKRGLIIISAVLGTVTACIPFIEPWMIWMVALSVFAIFAVLVGAFLYRYNKAEKTADNLINHIQDVKEKIIQDPTTKEALKKNLTQWNTEYAKSGSISDKGVEKFIEERLKEYGRL
jgi:hypothetical protein